MGNTTQRKYFKFLEENLILSVGAIASLIMLGFFTLYLTKFNDGLSTKQETWGQFGDFMGGSLNPMLGFITILILLATMNIQRRELQEQRTVAAENNRILTDQLRTMKSQALETTFFRVLEEIKNDAVVRKSLKAGNAYKIFLAVKMIEDFKKEGERSHSEITNLFLKRAGIAIGEFRHVIIQKIILIVQIAAEIQNNNLHYKLIQTTLSPILISAAAHHVKNHSEDEYAVLKNAKQLFRGINPKAIYNNSLANDLLDNETLASFHANYMMHEKERKENLEKFLAQQSSVTSSASLNTAAEPA